MSLNLLVFLLKNTFYRLHICEIFKYDAAFFKFTEETRFKKITENNTFYKKAEFRYLNYKFNFDCLVLLKLRVHLKHEKGI